jgi:beta-glucosidase
VPLQLEKSATESRPLRNLVVVDSLLGCDFLTQNSPAIALPTQLGCTTELIDLHTPTTIAVGQPTLFQLFIRSKPFRDSAVFTQMAQDWFERLLKSGNLQALVVYGSPYVLEQFLPALPASVPCVFSYGQMPVAQAIALKTLLDI